MSPEYVLANNTGEKQTIVTTICEKIIDHFRFFKNGTDIKTLTFTQ